MEDKYQSQINQSLNSFFAREELKGQQLVIGQEYHLNFNNGVVMVNMNIKPERIPLSANSVPEIIKAKMEEDFQSPQLSKKEMLVSYLDAAIAEKYMRRNFMNGNYQDTIKCAQRLIDNAELLKKYYPETDIEVANEKINTAKQFQHGAYLVWENPENSLLIMEMEAALENENYEDYKRIEKELNEFEPIIGK